MGSQDRWFTRRARALGAAATVVLILTALILWRSGALRLGGGQSPIHEANRAVQAPREERIEWAPVDPAVADATSLEEISEQVERLAARIEPDIQDPEGALTPAMRTSLAQTLARHVLARSSRSPDLYLSVADAEPGRWIGPENSEREWRLLEIGHKSLSPDIPFDKTKSRDMLRRSLENVIQEDGTRLVEVGHGPDARRIVISTCRTVEGMADQLQSSAEITYWIARSSHNAFRFRFPVRSPYEVARERRRLVVANCHQMVKPVGAIGHSEFDAATNLHTTWFWDPQIGAWQNHGFTAHGWNTSKWSHY